LEKCSVRQYKRCGRDTVPINLRIHIAPIGTNNTFSISKASWVQVHCDMSKDTGRRPARIRAACTMPTIHGTPTPPRKLRIHQQPVLRRRKMIDKDRIKGSAEQAKGKVKEWTGKVLGDKKTEAEGKTDQVKGKVQNAVGGLKDAMRGK
jgi:uncharacterized protein YjbJ (UPF0337 family)